MANTNPGAGSGRPAGIFKSTTQMVVVVTAALVLPVVIIAMVVGASGSKPRPEDEMSPEAIEARIRPVAGFELQEMKKGGPARTGEEVFKGVCTGCHTAGVSGAPKFGDKAAWAPRIAQGLDTLLQSATKGKNAMPPQAGGEYSDQEVANAVVYMANEGGANFEAPKLEEKKEGDE